MITVIVFLVVYLYTANWILVKNFAKGFLIQKSAKKIVDKDIINFIYKNTHIKLSSFNLQTSDKAFAYCGGMPGKPFLVISTTAYKKFKGDALEWLVLHEIGHYALYHTFWYILVEVIFCSIGLILLSFIHNLLFAFFSPIVFAVCLGSISIQTKKIFDLWANQYAVHKMDNPRGMADGMRLFIEQAKESGIYKDSILMRLFYPWNYGMYHRGISDSDKEMVRRKKNI